VVLHTTTSFVNGVTDQLAQCAQAGAHVVSATEELSFLHDRTPEGAERLDRVAREEGVVIVGTGANPGYATDTLPLMVIGVCNDVQAVRVERVVDASVRREPLQDKVGAGLSTDAFTEEKAVGRPDTSAFASRCSWWPRAWTGLSERSTKRSGLFTPTGRLIPATGRSKRETWRVFTTRPLVTSTH